MITPTGVMLHSTGANNPNLRRYVGPDDGLLGYNQHDNHWNHPTPGGKKVCVHAFIGKLADGIAPVKPSLIDHSEGYALGLASNHGDVKRWFTRHGKSMDTLRADVRKLLETPVTPPPDPNAPSDWAREAWEWGKAMGITDGMNPKASATREQTVTMLWRFGKLK